MSAEAVLLFSSFSRLVQADVIEEHLARAAGSRHIVPGSQADRYPVNVSQDYTLIGKRLQRNNPLGPGVYR